jgi:mannose-1-phosphate guanylyltransferase / phosphomannomutase
MAGGKGTRLYPLTCNLPKPMVPIQHKPVMEYCIGFLKKHGITEIAVTTCYLGSYIRNYFGNGDKWGVSLHYFDEYAPLGTAGSIKNAEDFLDEPFVVISGDVFTDFNISEGIRFHRRKDALVTVFMKKIDEPFDYGIIVTNEYGKIKRFCEKPNKWNEVFSNRVNTGIYVVDPAVFSFIPKGRAFDFSKDLFPLLIEKNEGLFGFLSNGYWSDIGTLIQYQKTNRDIINNKVTIPYNYSQTEIGLYEKSLINSYLIWKQLNTIVLYEKTFQSRYRAVSSLTNMIEMLAR